MASWCCGLTMNLGPPKVVEEVEMTQVTQMTQVAPAIRLVDRLTRHHIQMA
jgi:hypothetical protein